MIAVVGADGFIGRHVSRVGWTLLDKNWGPRFEDTPLPHFDILIWLVMNPHVDDDYYALEGLHNYLHDNPTTHVIYASSAAVYGDTLAPAEEHDVLLPFGEYGEMKLYGEKIILKNPHTTLRLSNVYGPGGKGVVNRFQNGLNTIYGDGRQTRDFVHVKVVRGVIDKIIENPENWQGIYNVSSNKPFTINKVFELYGKGVPIHVPAEEEIRHSCLSNQKLKNKLGL